MSTISASTASNTAFKVTSDTTGTLVFQTGAVPTTAISIDASQVVSIGNIAVTGATTFAAGSAAAPSITTTGDTNTGIFFPAANTIAASTDGTERLRLDSSGNLGIGTNSPAFRLHVSGSSSQFALISTTDTTSTTGVLFGDSASNTVGRIEYVHSTNGMAFFTNGTTQATLDSSGNLGIGTTSPTYKLVIASASANGLEIDPTNASGTQTAILSYNRATSAYTPLVVQASRVAIGPASFPVTINSSGSVGIGTTNPSASLHVVGTMMMQGVIEQVKITASAPPSTLNVDALSGSVVFLSASSANNWTVNFRGSAATSLNNMMYPGQSMTFAVLVNHATVGYTASIHQVDGTSITPRWQGGTLPSGSGTSTDIYSYTLIKTANAAFNIFAAYTNVR